MKNILIKNLKAGEERAVHGVALDSFVFVKVAPVELLLTIDGGQSLTIPQGGYFKLNEPIKSELRVMNLGSSNESFELVLGRGEYSEPQAIGEVITTPKNLKDLLTEKKSVNSTAAIIAEESNSRLKITFKNTGDNPVLISYDSDCLANGYQLSANEREVLEVSAGAEVWALSELGSEVSIISEFGSVQAVQVGTFLIDESGTPVLDENNNNILAE